MTTVGGSDHPAKEVYEGQMDDETKKGTHWQDDELDAIVADYFAMLEADLSGQPYVKSRHSQLLMAQIGRTQGISSELRTEFLGRSGLTCQMCGQEPGDTDPSNGRSVRLHLGYIKDKSLGGKDELSNLRALCSTCNRGAKMIRTEKPTAIWLLSQIRRAGQDEQIAVLKWLHKKFDPQ